MPRSGYRSASRSAIAEVSKVAKPRPGSPSQSTGTRRVSDSPAMFCSQSSESNLSIRSANGMPSWVISDHGRSDQEE